MWLGKREGGEEEAAEEGEREEMEAERAGKGGKVGRGEGPEEGGVGMAEEVGKAGRMLGKCT